MVVWFACVRSCAYRDLVGGALSCDPSWLEKSISLNPLSIGQFINNHTRCE